MMKNLFLAFLIILGLASVNQKVMGADLQPPSLNLLPTPATEVELQAGGDFYVLNVGNGRFLTRTVGDNGYGTRACVAGFISINKSGLANDSYKFTIAYDESTKYTLFSYGVNGFNEERNGYLYTGVSSKTDAIWNAWVDLGSVNDAAYWDIAPTSNAAFSIKSRKQYTGEPASFFAPQANVNYAFCYNNSNSTTYNSFIDWKFYRSSECAAYIEAVRVFDLKSMLSDAIDAANASKSAYETYSGYSAFVAVIASAQSVYDNATVDGTAVNQAVANLEAAERVCRLTQPVPANFTWMIANPDMEANPATIGWTKTGNAVNFKALAVSNRTGMSGNAIETWSAAEAAPLSRKVYQTILDVPNGFYKLTAAAFADYQVANASTPTTGAFIYANEYTVEVPIRYNEDVSAVYELYFRVTNNTIELGMKLEDAYANWCAMDNFTLTYQGTTLKLDDSMNFNTVAESDINVSYIRNFSAKKVNAETQHGWQTICLPFAATVTFSGRELMANEDYWLFKATSGRYEAVASIEANIPYLIAMPNDEEMYADGISIEGDVWFTGTSLEDTPAEAIIVDVHSAYNLVVDYKATNTGYGIGDFGEAGQEVSAFDEGFCHGTFWAYASKTVSNPAARFGIFGDNYSTGLRKVSNSVNAPFSVISVEGGIEITAETSQFVRIHALGGKLVKGIRVPEGISRITLPVGVYFVNGTKVSVNF